MGQKVNPHGIRVGVIKDWDSKWYAEADFSDNLVEDYNIRKFVKKKLYNAGISKIEIERASDRVKVSIYTAKPGVVIGKGGADIEKLKAEVQKLTTPDKKLSIDIKEIKRPDGDAQLVAENNNGMNPENLYIEECYANQGPIMKRIRPRAQGRAYRIEKRMCNLTIVLNEKK